MNFFVLEDSGQCSTYKKMGVGEIFILLHFTDDVQCPFRLIQLGSSISLLSLLVCMSLGFKMLFCVSKNLIIDFSNKRKCKIPSGGG